MSKLVILFLFLIPTPAFAQNDIQYRRDDSLKVVKLIEQGLRRAGDTNIILYFARSLKNIPYVAKTLDKNTSEQLVVNLRQMDCTTYVENVFALYLCVKNKKRQFDDFCNYLRLLRYDNGKISYIHRLHYFSQWIDSNTDKGFVSEVKIRDPQIAVKQTLHLDYMSKHPELYPALKNDPRLIEDIMNAETMLSGRTCQYIPKEIIKNHTLLYNIIQDGDILAIVTNKSGLDTSHIGIAVWHKDGLHLLNASMIYKKVVEEPMTLYNYMKKHPSQIGIRVIRAE